MRFPKKRSLMSILLALVLVFSFATAASADPYTYLTNPWGPSSGNPSDPGGSAPFTWVQPTATTHFQIQIISSAGTFSTGITPNESSPGSGFGFFSIPWTLYDSLPTLESILVVLTTYQWHPSIGQYSQLGYDDAWMIKFPPE